MNDVGSGSRIREIVREIAKISLEDEFGVSDPVLRIGNWTKAHLKSEIRNLRLDTRNCGYRP
jgi:hypothetical protein